MQMRDALAEKKNGRWNLVAAFSEKQQVRAGRAHTSGENESNSARMPMSTRTRAKRGAKKTYKTTGRVFEQFCQSSSIHGVKYIVDEESHWLER